MMKKWLALLLTACLLAGCALPGLSEAADAEQDAVAEAAMEENVAEEAVYSDGDAVSSEDEVFSEDEVVSGAVEAQPVEAAVEEISLDLGGADDGEDLPEISEEELEATEFDEYAVEDAYLQVPDIYDENFIRALMPSERIYPGLLVWPLQGQTPLTHVTSHVGWRDAYRIQQRQGGTWATWLHHGVDIAGVGTDQVVVAAASGIAYADHRSGAGNYVVIDHGNGWYTRYQHLSRFTGNMFKHARAIPVAAGEPIGYVGNSGGDYPVHFHFEIAWSPEGPGSDDVDFSKQTSNRRFYAYSFPQQRVVTLSWAKTWEICTAEYQFYYEPEDAPKPETTSVQADDADDEAEDEAEDAVAEDAEAVDEEASEAE